MDEPKQPQNSGSEEKAFAETLASDRGRAGGDETVPEVTNIGAERTPEKPDSKQPPWVGKMMGHFKLLRLIGEGSMGMVIQAQDQHLKRIVALKVLRKQLSTGEKGKMAIEQFLREARAAASIDHPNIVRVYEINQHSGWWYIAMEMVSGNSLQQIVKAAGALPPSRACPIIADAATGLQVAHELGMVHRDIKPGNILVTRNGHGKVSDFGLVRVDDPNDPFDSYAHQSIGTPYYMPPEIIRRETIGPAVDIYSLGATLYFVLTGVPPYTAEKREDVLKQHLYADPPNLQKALPDYSPNLAFLIRRMMAKNPNERPTAAEVAAILQAESIGFAADSHFAARPGGSTVGTEWLGIGSKTRTSSGSTILAIETPSSRRFCWNPMHLSVRWRWIVAAAILLVLGALGFWVFGSKSPPRQDRRAVSRLFPEAPESYGTRNTGTVPVPSSILTDVPGYSWKGKVDTSGVQFVASRTGRYFYPIDDPRAITIRVDLFVGYSNADEAIKDRKQPAP